jgi:CRP-like cAMP-binding protein
VISGEHNFVKLLKQFPVKRFAPGEMVLYQGEVPAAAYVIKTGTVKEYNISDQGDEKPIAFRGPSDILASAWVFGKSTSALFFYEAHTDCIVYSLTKEELVSLIRHDEESLYALLNRYVTLNTAGSLQLHALEYSRAADKILHMFFYLCQVHGRESVGDMVLIDLPLTQQDLANLLGLTRETTGIELLKLKKTGLLAFNKKKYRVNKTRLAQLIGETEFVDLEL